MSATITTAADGSYEFTALAPGSYEVSASASQLTTPKPKCIAVTTSQTTLHLQLGIVAQQREVRVVDSDAPSVATDSSSNAGAVTIRGADLNALGDDAQGLQADLLALAGNSGKFLSDHHVPGRLSFLAHWPHR